MNKLFIHLLYIGGVLCVTPILVQGYAKGKLTDAYAAGATANIRLGGYSILDYLVVLIGISIIVFVILKSIPASKVENHPKSDKNPNTSTQTPNNRPEQNQLQ